MSTEENRRLVRRYYEELWNEWNFDLAGEIISQDVRFRGSLGVEAKELRGFVDYMLRVKNAFPDFSNKVEELIAGDDAVAARLTYTGTHLGEIFGIAATGKPVTYSGAAIFKIADGKIFDGWVLGDVQSLLQQLNAAAASATAASGSSELTITPSSDEERLWAASLMATSEPWITLRRSPEQCRQACQNPTDLLFTARTGSKLCGFLLARRKGMADSPYIKSLAVEARFRGRGIGYQLLRFAEDLFSAESHHIFLCVSSFNDRARKFYERCGYSFVAELKDYVVTGANEILMHKRLGGEGPAPEPSEHTIERKQTRNRGRYKGKAVAVLEKV
jgi:steroid delta-isomerase-like uncharacterized protein